MSKPRTVKSESLYHGRVISLRVDTLDVGGGRTVQREVVEHPGAVVLAPVDEQGRILMVRQYRHAAGRTLLELPAGGIDPGEDPPAAAQRELQEETGFAAAEMRPAGGFFSAPGFCTEYLHFFIARGLRRAPLAHDADEDIDLVPVEPARARQMLLSGEVQDAKTIAGLLLLHLAEEASNVNDFLKR